MVRAIMILEMAGKPAEHVKESLGKHVGVLDELSYVEIHTNNVSEPKEIETQEEMVKGEEIYTCFAEVDFEVDNLARLSELMFDFMPSSIEVIEPAKLQMEMNEVTDLLNNISGRMHRYDEVARMAQGRVHQLAAELEAAQKGGEVKVEVADKKKKVKKKVGKKKVKGKVVKKVKKKVKK